MSKVLKNIALKNNIRTFPKNTVRGLSFAQYKNVKQINKFINSEGIGTNKQYVLSFYANTKRFYSTEYPNHTKVLLPALSPTMEMGTIVSWAKEEGDKLNEGDLLAEIETDKATMGFETPEEGYLAKILIPAGSKEVPIGKLVCIIVDDESQIAAFKNYVDDTSTAQAQAPSSPSATAAPSPQKVQPSPLPPSSAVPLTATKSSDRLFVSPLAKRLATEQGIDLKTVGIGSGIFGSIKSKDLSKATKKLSATDTVKPPMGDSYNDYAVSTVRNVIAKRLLLSKQTIPHYYLNIDLNLDEIVKIRKNLNEYLEKDGIHLTFNDFIIKATALASKKVPEANSAWMDTFIRQYNAVDVSVAVNSDKGLITPIIFDADKKGLAEISSDVKRLAAKAREGTLQPQEFQGGTISISNLGMFNIKSVSSIINPPQACILGVGAIQQRLVPDKSAPNGMKISEFVQFTLSCDHRVVDGAVGAQWLIAFRKLIEEPQHMLL